MQAKMSGFARPGRSLMLEYLFLMAASFGNRLLRWCYSCRLRTEVLYNLVVPVEDVAAESAGGRESGEKKKNGSGCMLCISAFPPCLPRTNN